MKILVLNCGSSSLKFQLIDMETEERLAKGNFERIGGMKSTLKLNIRGEKQEIVRIARDYDEAISYVLEVLTKPENDLMKSLDEIGAATVESVVKVTELAIKTPEEASVGQTIVVKSVDENGKPTAWEAADLSKSYRIIADVTLAETVSEIKIEKDTEDNPFELEDVYVYVSSILAEESTVEYSGSHIDIKACDVTGYTHHYHNACFIGSSLKPTAVPFTVRIKHLVDQNKDISILPTGNDEGTAQKTVTTNFIGKHKGWTAIPNGKIRGVLLRTFSPSAAFYGAGTRVMIIGR